MPRSAPRDRVATADCCIWPTYGSHRRGQNGLDYLSELRWPTWGGVFRETLGSLSHPLPLGATSSSLQRHAQILLLFMWLIHWFHIRDSVSPMVRSCRGGRVLLNLSNRFDICRFCLRWGADAPVSLMFNTSSKYLYLQFLDTQAWMKALKGLSHINVIIKSYKGPFQFHSTTILTDNICTSELNKLLRCDSFSSKRHQRYHIKYLYTFWHHFFVFSFITEAKFTTSQSHLPRKRQTLGDVFL